MMFLRDPKNRILVFGIMSVQDISHEYNSSLMKRRYELFTLLHVSIHIFMLVGNLSW